MPHTLNIGIRKGVQRHALHLLAKRLLEQNQTNHTHLLIKRRKDGKVRFKSVFSTKEMQSETVESLAVKIASLLKGRKFIHLVAKPNLSMHKPFDEISFMNQ